MQGRLTWFLLLALALHFNNGNCDEFEEFEGDEEEMEELEEEFRFFELSPGFKESLLVADNYTREETIFAVLYVHYFYSLNLTEFVDGKIGGRETGVKLSLSKCFEIVMYAVQSGYYTLAVEWVQLMRTKLRSISAADNTEDIDKETLDDMEKLIRKQHDQYYEEEVKRPNPFIYTRRIGQNKSYPQTMRDFEYKNKVGLEFAKTKEFQFINYVSLCNGRNLQTEQTKKSLKCWYDPGHHPYFKLSPFKLELLNKSPYLLYIHDLGREKAMKRIMETRQMEEGFVGDLKYGQRLYRRLFVNWTNMTETGLAERYEGVTDLHVTGHPSTITIMEYGFAGHSNIHIDVIANAEEQFQEYHNAGNIVATVTMYTTDVVDTGITAFVQIGLGVKPKRGGALLFYTKKRNGQIDYRTIHGSCPLIFGQKLTTLKWINAADNILRYPCTLDPYE